MTQVPPRLTRFLSAVLLASLAAACATASGGGGGGTPAAQGVGQPMPDLALREFWGGEEIRLSDLRGKVVLLDLWASWCPPCKEEMPVLDDMAARLREKGIEIIAVSIDEDRANAEQFLRRRARWALKLAHDPAGTVPERLQPPTMPTSYVIDAQGVLRHVIAGFRAGDAKRIELQLLELASGR
jgi:thiol-disulfide isomerase/thioredoxin